jgi:hypothetical protein
MMIFAPENDATGSAAQGGGYSNNTISGVTLGDAKRHASQTPLRARLASYTDTWKLCVCV